VVIRGEVVAAGPAQKIEKRLIVAKKRLIELRIGGRRDKRAKRARD
jgi:hypothetical protein